MNSVTTIEAQTLAAEFTRGTDQLPHDQRTTAADLLRALRNFHPTHDEMIYVINGLSSCVNHSENSLTNKCTRTVVDQLDEAVGQIEQDKIDQQAEQMWLNSKRVAA